jgi:hypothetical protein
LLQRRDDLEQRIERLVDAPLDGKVDQATYDRTKTRLDAEREKIDLELQEPRVTVGDLGDTLSLAESLLTDLPCCWNRLDRQLRAGFLRSIAPTGLTYDNGAI